MLEEVRCADCANGGIGQGKAEAEVAVDCGILQVDGNETGRGVVSRAEIKHRKFVPTRPLTNDFHGQGVAYRVLDVSVAQDVAVESREHQRFGKTSELLAGDVRIADKSECGC